MTRITRSQVASFVAGLALASTLGIADVTRSGASQVPCNELGSVRSYISELFTPDYEGRPDLDTQNDYLADVPDRCKAQARRYATIIARANSEGLYYRYVDQNTVR